MSYDKREWTEIKISALNDLTADRGALQKRLKEKDEIIDSIADAYNGIQPTEAYPFSQKVYELQKRCEELESALHVKGILSAAHEKVIRTDTAREIVELIESCDILDYDGSGIWYVEQGQLLNAIKERYGVAE